ncbi:MAG: hypothetical protein QNJ68_10390 [Microcoleaceae cyanobacterium MO_207.B10]|nr:hypothetical protein [Microcoleaceae cyanobacterium MO_207.B10]
MVSRNEKFIGSGFIKTNDEGFSYRALVLGSEKLKKIFPRDSLPYCAEQVCLHWQKTVSKNNTLYDIILNNIESVSVEDVASYVNMQRIFTSEKTSL